MIENYKIEKLTSSIGAEIKGFDFTKTLNQKDYDFIYKGLIYHKVVFIRNQFLSPKNHLDLARSFGEIKSSHPIYPHLEDFPEITLLENNKNNPPDTDVWHTDLTFKPNPPFASILYSRIIPSNGGDTLWSCLSTIYDALPIEIKNYLETLNAVHDMGDFRNTFVNN